MCHSADSNTARTHGWRLLPDAWRTEKFAPLATPQDVIYGMLDAARAGDARAYLNWFSGEMQTQLFEVVKENSEPTFAAYLKSQNLDLEGVAVSVTDRPSDSVVQLRVEYIYRGHNEVQGVHLRKESSGWKIVKLTNAESVRTPLPFGTGVTD
jgi:hypothetical protein